MTQSSSRQRVVLITGAASGIGETTARAFAAAGAAVAVVDRDLASAEVVARSIELDGGTAYAVEADVSDSAAVNRAFQTVIKRYGRLDTLVNNAGVGVPATKTADLTDEQWHRVISVNLDGVFFCTRAAIRQMQLQGSGSIVNVASILGQVASAAGSVAYTASKHAVIGLTKNAALEYAIEGIRVNAIGPGYVMTPLAEQSMSEHMKQDRLARTPLGRFGQPHEIAALIMWLVGDDATFVTGAYYPIDGGYLIQ